MNAAASSWRTWMKRTSSWRFRSASMMPLMPSPGIPKMVSTPQSIRFSTRISAPVFAIARSFRASRNYIAGRMRGPASEEGNGSDPLPDRVEQGSVQRGCLAARWGRWQRRPIHNRTASHPTGIMPRGRCLDRRPVMTRVQVEFDFDVFSTLRRSPEEVAQEMRLAAAILWYAQGRISQSRAAELAGVSRAELLDALAASGVSVSQETLEDLDEVLARGRPWSSMLRH